MGVLLPDGYRIERLTSTHARREFDCGEAAVNKWLRAKARQAQEKRLSITRVLVHGRSAVAGFYTLAIGQVNFDMLPHEETQGLPRTALPIATLAWLGVDRRHQRRGLGTRLIAQALADCHEAGQRFSFVAVILDCLNELAKRRYTAFDFAELPGHPMRLFLSWRLLDAMMQRPAR